MPKKRIKIGNTFVEIDEKDIQDVEQELDADGNPIKKDETEADPEPEADAEADAGVDANAEKALRMQAKKLGGEIAKQVIKDIGLDSTTVLQKKLDSIIKSQMGENSKLKQILNGKDIYSKDELTKDEKILGFFNALVTNNQVALKALSEGSDADGGYLFPNEFLAELVQDLPNVNVMRQYVRIIPMRRDKMDISTLVSGPKVTWTAENAAKSTTSAHFGTKQLVAYKMAAILYSSDELVEDSDTTDVVSLIIRLFTEAIADEEEKVIWTGNGTTQPQGLTVGTVGGTVTASGQDFDDINALYYALPQKYRVNAAFFMNDNTAMNVSKLKDSNGRYLWQDAISEQEPPRLKGKPAVISDWVPNGQIFFGDLKRGYFLGDRKRITVKVSNDTETAFTKDQTAIRVVERIGGLIVLSAAIRKLTGF